MQAATITAMTGRPQPDEVAAYFFTYIDQVAGDDPFQVTKNQLEDCRLFFSTISEEKSQHRYAPGKWSIREVLSHITDTERAFVFRALWFARGFDTQLPSYDQEISAAGANADAISWGAHVEEFIARATRHDFLLPEPSFQCVDAERHCRRQSIHGPGAWVHHSRSRDAPSQNCAREVLVAVRIRPRLH